MVIVYWLSTNSKKENDIAIYYRVYWYFMEQVGYKNSYNHEVIAIQRYDNYLKKFISIKSCLDFSINNSKISLKDKFLNRVIDFLEKLKK